MNRYGKAFLAFIICVSLAIPCLTGLNYSVSLTDFSEEKYLSEVSEIYREYDGDLSQKDVNDPLALNRLIVSNYNGKAYGSVKRAWDKKHKIGILQYETRSKAEKALKIIKSDGLTAEGDSVAYFDDTDNVENDTSAESVISAEVPRFSGTKGTFSPTSSTVLGTTDYIGKLTNDDEVIVAIVDTGVMYEHTSISDRFYSTGYDLSSDHAVDAHYDTNEGDYYHHATMVAGIIADNTPDNVKILPYKAVAFGESGAAASAIMNGVYSATAAGAKVISVSLSTNGCENQLRDAVADARSQGVCVCASAGNSSLEVTDRFPACTPYAITVSALESDNETFANFSNYGSCIDFCAPGRRIRSTAPINNASNFKVGSGTSFSTPYISACCACIKADYPDMPRDDVYASLCDFARDLGDSGYDVYFGNGCPYIGNMVYTDGDNYRFRIPENDLEIYNSVDYTADTQPWKRYANIITDVSVDESIDRIGNYAFYNMPNAEFTMNDVYDKIGDYAFYGCTQITEYTCTIDVEEVGQSAFGGIEGFVLNGYRNTPAETYALSEGVTFNALGCKHNYKHVVYDPTKTSEGYTLYTCVVCGDQYIGRYIEPVPVESGVCGDNLTYTYYDTGRLTIDGSGDMYDYINESPPWAEYKDDIIVLQIKDNVGEISPFAFYGCSSLSRFFISDENTYYYDDDEFNLVRKSDGELILAIMGAQNMPYTVPLRVNRVTAAAFVFNIPSAIIGEGLTTENGIVYDSSGNIVMALPSFNQNELTFTRNTNIERYAFILTPKPLRISGDYININPGEYSLGYYYNGTMNKLNALFVTNSASGLYTYAVENGFSVDLGTTGRCGNDIVWRYDEDELSLTLSGSGDMYEFDSADLVPWAQYISTLKKVVIGDEITSVSTYSFSGASKLNDLTLPLSIEAPKDTNTWKGCTAIKKITLTLGTGRTDDYIDDQGNELYKFTPWYISRSSITSFNLDENVRYITQNAFRNCTCIKTLTFNCIERIEEYAFVACTGLTDITNYCKTTVYEPYSIFSYRFGTASGGYYSGRTLHAYSDSTSKDFCETTEGVVAFDSIGCGHTRGSSYSREVQRDEFITDTLHLCDDCNEEFVYSSVDTGSQTELTVLTKRGMAVENAEIYIGNQLFGTTDSKGAVSGKLAMGEYTLELRVHGISVLEAPLVLDKNTVNAQVRIQYANYVDDGAINGKDYAYAMRYGFDDYDLFDFGKINEAYNGIIYDEN